MAKTDTPEPQPEAAAPVDEAPQAPSETPQARDAPSGDDPQPRDEAQDPADADRAELAASVEAALFSSDKPMPAAKVNEVAQVGGVRAVRKAVDDLNAEYERSGRSFRIVEIAGGYQYQTLPEYGDVLARLRKSRSDTRLSQAALETLAIVAYRQPVVRADIENIRGVACGEVLRGLMEKNLLRIAGRAEELGRPILYGTTRHFLELFGLADIEDLPNAEQLRMPPGAAETIDETEEPPDDGPVDAEAAAPDETPAEDAPREKPPAAEASDEDDDEEEFVDDDELDDDDEFIDNDDDDDEFEDDDDEFIDDDDAEFEDDDEDDED